MKKTGRDKKRRKNNPKSQPENLNVEIEHTTHLVLLAGTGERRAKISITLTIHARSSS